MLFFTTACYSDCGKSKVMAKGVKIPFDVPVEVTEPNLSSLIYNLPLNHPDGVAIIQGPLNLNAGCSHGYLNCLYALDFATCTPPGKILAARSGVVVALHDEGIADGAFYNVDSSGDGFGNWVAVKHEFNEVSFYAHLNEIKVAIGDHLESGQEIGIEGSTGQAGARHLHFSVHRLIGEKSENICPYNTSQYESIPYRLQCCTHTDGQLQIIDIRTFAKINDKNTNKDQEKLFHVSNYHHPLLDRLREMYKEDQESCFQWINAEEDKKDEYSNLIMNIRRKHNHELKEIIQQYGWPTYESIGTEGSEALWLLVQHQDEDVEFQKLCLGLLKSRVEQGQASYKNYAYLLDRTRMNEKLPQIYGTQWGGNKGEIAPYQVENIGQLDERRSQAGLCSLSEYKELLKKAYHFNDEDFK